VGFFRGFLAPFRGAVYIGQQRLWHYLVAPILLNLALGGATLWAAARYTREELGHLMATSPVVGGIILFVLTVLGGVVLFILLQPLMNAIFCDRLSEAVEKRVRGSAPAAPFFASTGRALVHGLLKLMLYAVALVIGMVLTAATGVGSLVGVALGAIFLAYDGFDYPLARRSRGFAQKWGYLVRSPGQTIGFGLGATVLYLIPLAMFVAPAFTSVGATLAYLDTEARAEAKAAARKKPDESAAPTTTTSGAMSPKSATKSA
jgi:uncharacterized protein involved in cysteine biosynthesis